MAQTKNPDKTVYAANCEACGMECMSDELKSVKLARLSWELKLCVACADKDPAEDYSSAADDLRAVIIK